MEKTNVFLIRVFGKAIFSPSYFAGSCGGAPISIIKQYNRTAEHNRLEK